MPAAVSDRREVRAQVRVTRSGFGSRLGITLLLAAAAAPVCAQRSEPPPGEPVTGAAWRPRQMLDECSELRWSAPAAPTSGRVLSESCEITQRGEIRGSDGTSWPWTLARRSLVYGPTPDTDPRDIGLYPDTVVVAEITVFVRDGERVRPVWHDRADLETELLEAPRAMRMGGVDLLVHRRCLIGTGGCLDHPYVLGRDGAVIPLTPRYRAMMQANLPGEWGFWKGIWLDPGRDVAHAAVYLPGDENCCPSFLAEATLRLSGDTLEAESVTLTPNPESDTWLVRPGEQFGPVSGETSEAELRRRLGEDAVTRTEVYLAEGFCTAGTRLLAGTRAEADIGWTTAARDRPAFVRAGQADGPWHTPAGVRIGSTLADLERLGGRPLAFSGFGWDYGGGATWEEGAGALGLHLSPDSTAYRVLGELEPRDARVRELFGDRTIRSDHPLLRGIRIVVGELSMGWDHVADEHECR